MVFIPPSCLRPPPDLRPSFLCLMQRSSSLKMMVTALPSPSQPGPPPDPPPNKRFPVEMLSAVKPPEPPDPPDVSASFVLLRICVTFSRSSPQATQILHLMWVSSKLSDGDAVLVVIGDTILVNWPSFPVIYRSYLCPSFPVLYRVNRILVGNVLIDSVSYGYIFMSLGGFHSVIEWSLHTVSFYFVIECLSITSWFQICLTSSRVEYLMLNCRFSTRLKDCSTDDSFSVLFKGSASWCHIASAIPNVVEIRGRLYNVDAAWNAKFMHCDIGGIFSGENTIILPNLCKSRNHVLSALMAEAIAVGLAVAITVYSNIRPLGVLSDSLSLIKLLKNGGFQPKLFDIMFDIYHYLSYFDVISSIFIFQNFDGKTDAVVKLALSLVVTIPLVGV